MNNYQESYQETVASYQLPVTGNQQPATGNQQPATGNQQPATGNQQPETKKLTWQTNYNNKLACHSFIHLDIAPPTMPHRSDVEQMIFEISTADGSHPPVQVQLIDITLLGWENIPPVLIFCSHGITEQEFTKYLFEKHDYQYLARNRPALYYYTRVDSQLPGYQ